VHGLARTEAKAKQLASQEILPVIGDMTEPDSYLPTASECQVVIHCAVDHSERRMALDRQVIEQLIGACESADQSRLFIYTSGVWIYGNTGMRAVDETGMLDPSPFIVGRRESEQLMLDANGDRLRTFVIRPGCVYGGSGSLTATWFESALTNGAATVFGDGSNRWAMVHRDDLADLYLRVAESSLGGEIFNATDRSRFTVLECARAASEAVGAGGKVAQLSREDGLNQLGSYVDGLLLDQHVDSSKAVRYLGWQPRHGGFVDGVNRYFESWRAARQ
jgi:nucleoside-diphosphate-sugar epimerase